MDKYLKGFDSEDDIRFGKISIFYNPGNSSDRIMKKLKRAQNNEEFRQINEEAAIRMKLNHENILTLIDIQPDQTTLSTTVCYEFPEGYLDIRTLDVQKIVCLFRDILKAVINLKTHKMIHGDIRSEYFAYFSTTNKYKLLDRLGDPQGPLGCQKDKIENYRSLYMAPVIFNELMAKNLKFKQNSYKSEVFALGMNILERFTHTGEIQDL